MRKYHYLVLFMIGFLVLWPFMLHKLYIEQAKNTETFVEQAQAEGAAEPESGVYDVSGGEAQEEENKEAAKEGSSGQTDAEQETEEDTDLTEETEEPEVTEQDAIQEEITEEQESVDEPEE